jgi:phage gp46-like protein
MANVPALLGPSPVPDVRLIQTDFYPAYSVTLDWNLLLSGTLDDTQALATAIMVALGTNGLADADDQLPDPDSTDRMGWWGDMDAETIWSAWPIGSKLWLLRRSSILPPNAQYGATLAHVKNYIYAAIQPFVDNRICTTFTVEAWRQSIQAIYARIRVYRGPLPDIELRYQILWAELQASQQNST